MRRPGLVPTAGWLAAGTFPHMAAETSPTALDLAYADVEALLQADRDAHPTPAPVQADMPSNVIDLRTERARRRTRTTR